MQFTLQRKTDLALRALNLLAESDGQRRAGELAVVLDSTPEFMPQVLAPLIRAGWVVSQRGPTGGYRLNADPDKISVRDVIEAVEGPVEPTRCVLRGGPCSTDINCALHDAWSNAFAALLTQLGQTPATLNHKENQP